VDIDIGCAIRGESKFLTVLRCSSKVFQFLPQIQSKYYFLGSHNKQNLKLKSGELGVEESDISLY